MCFSLSFFLFSFRKMKNAQVLPVVVGITLCTASAALFYKWYKTRNAKQDVVDGPPRPRFKPKPKQKQNETKIDVTIPNETVQLVMGRSGANIKSIEERCGVKITFRDKDGKTQICEITGTYESVMQAATSVNDEIRRAQCVTEDVVIPKSTHEKISLKILKDICHQTATKIRIDGGLEDKTKRKLEITGSFPNVQKAKRLIEEQVRLDAVERENKPKREPRYNQKNSPINSSVESLSKQSCKSH